MVTAVSTNDRMTKKDVSTAKPAARAKKEADGATTARRLLDSHPGLKTTVAQIEKQFGEGAIMPLGLAHTQAIEGIPTGSLSLDLALGGMGVPKGRIVEVFGPESSGKTTLALHVVASAQRAG